MIDALMAMAKGNGLLYLALVNEKNTGGKGSGLIPVALLPFGAFRS